MKNIIISVLCILTLGLPAKAQEPSATLTSESLENVQIIRGMPVILHFSIARQLGFSYEEAVWDLPDSVLRDPVFIRKLDSVFAPVQLSKPGDPWYSGFVFQLRQGAQGLSRSDLHLLKPLPSDTHQLDPQTPLHLWLGIDPGTTRALDPGKTALRIGIPVAGTGDTIWSNDLRLDITTEKIKSEKKCTAEQQRKVARYWLLRGECTKAAPLAGKLYGADSTYIGNTMLMAMVAECGEKTETALHYYYKAYEQYMRQPEKGYEPPDLLMMKIGELQEKFYLKEP
ncbi:MAG TPA: hypothetical protein P5228_05875 [Bacteroidales bacterium]|nr:hypothetical protein [Bacteroidales bacterium]HRZ49702.1 hypothetical protein [Bacteroidales bacterium]